jgi:signal transduction histidine kinase
MQLGLTFRFLFLIIVVAFFIAFETYITIRPVILGYIPDDLIGHVVYQIVYRVIIFIIPLILVILAVVIIFSHRIAGPIYNIEQKIKRLTQGEDIGLIRLRKGDELQDLAKAINKLILMVKKSDTSSKNNSTN